MLNTTLSSDPYQQMEMPKMQDTRPEPLTSLVEQLTSFLTDVWRQFGELGYTTKTGASLMAQGASKGGLVGHGFAILSVSSCV